MGQQYNDPLNNSASTIGPQLRTDYYHKKALIEARKEQYFSQLADVTSMPKNMGKKISKFHYLPLLDDANLNDQGIDAAGVTIDSSKFSVRLNKLVYTEAVEADADAIKAAIDAVGGVIGTKAGAGPYTITVLEANRVIKNATLAQKDAIVAAIGAEGVTVTQNSGNLYGSSKDIGTISGKLPVLSEAGGRVNRVGFKRKQIDGTLEKFGFFDEYTQESLDFDSDEELEMHVTREMVNGAVEITEDVLQIDLINAAGVIKYAGAATTKADIDETCLVDYADLMRLSIDLDNNRTPKQTKVITGTRMTDTRTLPAGRVMYIGSELLPTFKGMVDLHSNPAFISVEKYAAAGDTLIGEVGAVDQFRVVVVPEMMKWAGAGADVGAETAFYDNGTNFDVFPILVVGDESFTTIGFQTDGKSVKFKITHKKPGEATADRNDPYGEMGFMSIKWYYGFLALRPERIALLMTAAKL